MTPKNFVDHMGVCISYDLYNIKEIFITNKTVKNQNKETIVKVLILTFFDFWKGSMKIYDKGFFECFITEIINNLDNLTEVTKKTIGFYKEKNLTTIPITVIFFLKENIITKEQLMQISSNFRFSDTSINEALFNEFYDEETIYKNIELFDIDHLSSLFFIKKDLYSIPLINWNLKKMYKQKLNYDDVVKNIFYFSNDLIKNWSALNCTTEQRETLFLLKQIC